MMVKFLFIFSLLTLNNLSSAQNAEQTSESNTPEQCEIFTQVCLDSEDNNTGKKIFSDKDDKTINTILELYNDYARLKGKDSFT